MLEVYPDYYKGFACLGGACPDTCCAQWEVVVDDDTAALYASIPGKLGEKLRDTLTLDEDGDRILKFAEGRCPLLTGEGLCGVQKALGHGALCKTCREFPRLCQDYTLFREHSLSLSCPEAARLILLAPQLPVLEVSGQEEPAEEPEFDLRDLSLLRETRDFLFSLLASQDLPLARRLALCLEAAGLAQARLDGDPAPEEASGPEHQPWDPHGFRDLFRSMDILNDEWSTLLGLPLMQGTPDPFLQYPQIFSNFCHDAFYRNLFCAVADFDLLPRVQAAVAACLLCRDLTLARGGSREALLRTMVLYDREVEHCADNRDALLDACCEAPFLSPAALLAQLL